MITQWNTQMYYWQQQNNFTAEYTKLSDDV